jgi:hypothetical protein
MTTYFPLILEWKDKNNPWKLELQTKPEFLISFSGEFMPPVEQIILTLSEITNAPVWLIGVIECCIGVALKQKGIHV